MVMAISTHSNSTVANKELLLEVCNMKSPHLLVGTLPTIPALPIRRSVSIELDLVSHIVRLAHNSGVVVLPQCRDGH
eukprot:7608205-Prorocentrum_lima.AAC.1